MDPAKLIESQIFTPKWQNDGITEYIQNVNYHNYYGRGRVKCPHPNGLYPVIEHDRYHPRALKQHDKFKTRYRHPGGLQYVYLDQYGTNNSRQKVSKSTGYLHQEIRENPGICENPVGYSF